MNIKFWMFLLPLAVLFTACPEGDEDSEESSEGCEEFDDEDDLLDACLDCLDQGSSKREDCLEELYECNEDMFEDKDFIEVYAEWKVEEVCDCYWDEWDAWECEDEVYDDYNLDDFEDFMDDEGIADYDDIDDEYMDVLEDECWDAYDDLYGWDSWDDEEYVWGDDPEFDQLVAEDLCSCIETAYDYDDAEWAIVDCYMDYEDTYGYYYILDIWYEECQYMCEDAWEWAEDNFYDYYEWD